MGAYLFLRKDDVKMLTLGYNSSYFLNFSVRKILLLQLLACDCVFGRLSCNLALLELDIFLDFDFALSQRPIIFTRFFGLGYILFGDMEP